MSGHSKWANIKHRKAASDKKKGRIFSRMAKEIMVAAKTGGADASANPRLRTALAAARAVNMPNANIDRAVKKGSGELEGVNFEEITYEGYGAGGAAVMAECLTDNRNRTAGEIRMIFDRNSGNLAGAGSVAWSFSRKARVMVTGENANEDKLMEIVIDAGAENIEVDGAVAEIFGPPESLEGIMKALDAAAVKYEETGIIRQPQNYIEVKDASAAQQLVRLIEKLEDHDDVQAVYSNFDIPSEIMEKLEQ
jgi:YebC/PmpR family DNA-binding regulatory protein